MFSIIVMKELKSIVFSPKFPATFVICSLLLLLSVGVGIREYHAATRAFESAQQLAEQELREARSWSNLKTHVYRSPNPMLVFVAGVQNDIGQESAISHSQPVKLTSSNYSNEPIYALFRFLDFAFIVQVVLSLFAILFTFDAINGERESGTLQLSFANPLPRVQFVTAKFIGAWLGLVLPLSIPILVSILLVVLFKIPLTSQHWFAVIGFVGVSLLLFTFFVAFGLLVSALTKRSSTSFLVSLVAWIVMSFIIPRAGVMAAGIVRPVLSVAEVEGQRDAFAKQAWAEYRKRIEERALEREKQLRTMTPDERQAYSDAHAWEWLEADDKERKHVLRSIDDFSLKLDEQTRNSRNQQRTLAFALSRFSPTSAYSLAAMTLTASNVELKTDFESALSTYRSRFNDFADTKEKESGGVGGIRITVDSEGGFKFQMNREGPALDVTGVPRFQPAQYSFAEAGSAAVLDAALLTLYTVLAVAGAFVAFLRYDLRT